VLEARAHVTLHIAQHRGAEKDRPDWRADTGRFRDKAHTLNKKRPLLAPAFPAVQGANVRNDWVMNARDARVRTEPPGGYAAAAPAFFAIVTNSAKAALSRTARSASIFRSISTPAACKPLMKRL
jgi:hypothetical protein